MCDLSVLYSFHICEDEVYQLNRSKDRLTLRQASSNIRSQSHNKHGPAQLTLPRP
jgi:hypothetical protein